MNTRPFIFFLFACLLFFAGCKCKSDTPRKLDESPQEDTTAVKPPPLEDFRAGQDSIYKIWQHEDKLAPLRPAPTEISKKERQKLIEGLKAIGIATFDRSSNHYRSLEKYRNKILECAEASGFASGYCIGEMMFFLNAPVADFALDEEASRRFQNPKFTERISNQAKFMKSLLVPKNNKPLPKGAALVYGELCLFSIAVFNADPPYSENRQAQFARVALFAVDVSQVPDTFERDVLWKLRQDLMRWSQDFASDDWDKRRMECAVYLLQALDKLDTVSPSSYHGTKYAEVAGVVDMMGKLVR